MAAPSLATPVRRAIIREVRAMFNDTARGESPVQRSDNALFTPDDVTWRVHGDVVSMLAGGVASLMMQMLHPRVLAGVWDHSNFRTDMHGRLRRTARFIAQTTYGDRGAAEAVIDRVRRIHAAVGGTLPDGTPYRADDPHLLAWVHVTETTSFLDGWIRYGEPGMRRADQDRYFAEMARMGRALGADPVPESRAEAERLIASYRPELRVDDRTREVLRLLLAQRAPSAAAQPVQALTMQAGIDLLPGWAQRMHGLNTPMFARPLVRAGTTGIARTLRWAFS
ncbi:oxygenase MpaB family protein [Sphingomonas sp. BGYR3]|uniref:oxygenase MpaB family protein n=1 Tax=Sphingomonas sp. BGYR3 TaxID=2975483 RepID=UPI0021A7A837|nr:oxygenase MpaB family protein [Sphingomonas sp. BGYR3]MDG5489229.1 oxygenase MpaB family protein [Sphingomonas sp. BGYR3]